MFKVVRALALVLVGIAAPCAAVAQPIETLGTRAAGMGGAFVAVADDASAVYWNPGGLASGAFFSLLIDRTSLELAPNDPWAGSSRSGGIIALSTPPLGLSYYRLRHTLTSAPGPAIAVGGSGNDDQPRDIRVESLVTHHAGVTLVQSLADTVAVGATLRIVRGVAASGLAVNTTRDALLAHDDLIGRASNSADADVGIMASLGILRAGLTVRNLREPEFAPAGAGAPLKLNRQIRAGVSVLALQDWLLAFDFDFTREPGPLGETRNLAAGLEGRLHPRATVRGGLRFNTIGDTGPDPAFTGGGSFAVFGSAFIDAQVTGGSRDADRGWGISGRVLF